MSKTGITSVRTVVRSLKIEKTMAIESENKGGFASSLASSLVGGVGSFFSSLIPNLASGLANQIFGETLEDKQRYALEQMEQQHKYNMEMYGEQIKTQLKYSDPAFIRKRLEDAGLSASLALGNGGMSSPISGSVGSSSTAGGISSSLHPGQAINIAESMSRIRNMDADTESKKTDTDYQKKAMQTRLAILSEEKLSKMYANTIARIDALYKEDLTIATLDKLQKEMDAITFDMANRKDLTDIERQKLGGYLDSLTHQFALWQSQIDLNKAKETTESSVARLNNAKAWNAEYKNAILATSGIEPGQNLSSAVSSMLSHSIVGIGQRLEQLSDNVKNKLNSIKIGNVKEAISDVEQSLRDSFSFDDFVDNLLSKFGK